MKRTPRKSRKPRGRKHAGRHVVVNGKLKWAIGVPGALLACVMLILTIVNAIAQPIKEDVCRHEAMLKDAGESTSKYLREIKGTVDRIEDTLLVWRTRGKIR